MNASKPFTIILQVQPGHMAVCKLSPQSPLPTWLNTADNKFFSITKTNDELSIVCDQSSVPEHVQAQKNWRMFKIKGQMEFELVGILKQVLNPLAESGIGIFAISTYDTDYILVQEKDFENAIKALKTKFEIQDI